MMSVTFNENRSTWKRSLLCLVALAFATPGCSLATDFDQDDKPCDGYQKCEDGYYCQIQDEEKGTGICVKSATKAWGPVDSSQPVLGTLPRQRDLAMAEHAEGQVLQPCEENACLRWRGHVCDVERQICVPQT